MLRTTKFLLTVLSAFFSSHALAFGLADCTLSESQAEDSRFEHIFGGVPDDSEIHERRGYAFAYDGANLVPRWAAWHASRDYRDTPERKSRWSAFRTDPALPEVVDAAYVGWFDTPDNFARGHIVPYFVSGGDRDNDGKDAEIESSLQVEDEDDACTVYEVNALSNISPQYHDRFNGSPGVWFQLESDVRVLLDEGNEYQLFAGTVFINGQDIQRIGDRDDNPSRWKIGVPHGFFQIVIDVDRDEAVGFLFDHQGDLVDGCDIDEVMSPSECVTTIEKVEAATGLTFFNNLIDTEEQRLRASSNQDTWDNWVRRLP